MDLLSAAITTLEKTIQAPGQLNLHLSMSCHNLEIFLWNIIGCVPELLKKVSALEISENKSLIKYCDFVSVAML